jgi:thiamine biosynthesis lipoprotein
MTTAMTTAATTTVRLRAMATDVTLTVVAAAEQARPALDRAAAVFTRIEAACTRFDPTSPLMTANALPQEWHVLPPECFEALAEAWHAYQQTEGLFDPRVLDALVRLGYDRTLAFAGGAVTVRRRLTSDEPTTRAGLGAPVRPVAGPWRPELDVERHAVRLGDHAIDLGGIGKGLAVRRAAAELATLGVPFLVEAGGDLAVGGDGPDGEGWLVGVENPLPGTDHRPELVAVLRLEELSCATSSVRVRHWQADGRPVHHLIDPRTGDSSRTGLQSVTVVATDAATAEVWSKALFILGRADIEAACRARGLAALWVQDDGNVGTSPAMGGCVVWEAPHAD